MELIHDQLHTPFVCKRLQVLKNNIYRKLTEWQSAVITSETVILTLKYLSCTSVNLCKKKVFLWLLLPSTSSCMLSHRIHSLPWLPKWSSWKTKVELIQGILEIFSTKWSQSAKLFSFSTVKISIVLKTSLSVVSSLFHLPKGCSVWADSGHIWARSFPIIHKQIILIIRKKVTQSSYSIKFVITQDKL